MMEKELGSGWILHKNYQVFNLLKTEKLFLDHADSFAHIHLNMYNWASNLLCHISGSSLFLMFSTFPFLVISSDFHLL